MIRSRIASRIFVGLMFTAAAATPAAAVFPGQPGVLVFSSQDNIFTIALDGQPPLSQLTFDGGSHQPRWSPTGDHIAFERSGDIYVMAANGRNVRRLTTMGRSSEPAWAPSGKRLVFVHRASFGAVGDLWIVPISGGAPSRLTYQSNASCHIGHPSWSPLGGRIAYEWERKTASGGCSTSRVVVMRIEPRERVVIPMASDPDFTADGRGIFFASAWDPDIDAFLPGVQVSWSNLAGGQRERRTFLLCSEGASCFFGDAVGSPESSFPGVPAYAFVFQRVDGTQCVRSIPHLTLWCDTDIPVFPVDIDWQAIPA